MIHIIILFFKRLSFLVFGPCIANTQEHGVSSSSPGHVFHYNKQCYFILNIHNLLSISPYLFIELLMCKWVSRRFNTYLDLLCIKSVLNGKKKKTPKKPPMYYYLALIILHNMLLFFFQFQGGLQTIMKVIYHIGVS